MGFQAATTVDEALHALGELGAEARVIAGGSDVMMQRMTGELPSSQTLVHIGRIPELRGVSHSDGVISVGAVTTHRDLRKDRIINTYLPSFAAAAATVGGWQTQEVGTIGGNLCNASPAADLGPPVLMADAILVLSSTGSERRVPAIDFFLGRRQTVLEAGELLTSIEVAEPPDGSWETYLKVGRRSAMEVAIVGLAARFVLVDGVVSDARLAFCSVAPMPIRAVEAEAALVGTTLDDDVITTAAELARSTVSPIDDQRATASYRTTLVPRLVRSAAEACRSSAGVR